MFEKNDKRYLTKGVNEQVPEEIQSYCWQLIDKKRKEAEITLDYLQIFEFNRDDQRQAIEVIHRQEELFFIQYHEYKIIDEVIQKYGVTTSKVDVIFTKGEKGEI